MILCRLTPKATGGLPSKIPLIVNGKLHDYTYGRAALLPEAAIELARASNALNVELLDTEKPVLEPISTNPPADDVGERGAAAGDLPGGEAGGGDSDFDAEAIIKGTVKDVEERIANLTLAELAAVEAAETDREQSRVGVLAAIIHARKAFEGE